MKKFILYYVLLNMLIFGHASYSCTPNTTFMDDCNTCRCNEYGTMAKCTMIECLPSNNLITTTEDSVLETTTINGNQVCTPNDINMRVEKNETCNRCKCAANGIGWFCTKIPCPPNNVHKRNARNVEFPKQVDCKAGARWSNGCNSCFCAANNLVGCTLKGCDRMINGNFVSYDCIPGHRWNNGCNDCHCKDNGREECTDKKCPDDSNAPRYKRSYDEGDERCTPGARWKIECNECFCTETGIAACTLRGCLGRNHLSNSDASKSTRVPQPAIRTISREEFDNPDFECTPHEYFKLECNNCKCSSSGRGARCTKKSCL